jgi:transcriptional regulatory protein RtcR
MDHGDERLAARVPLYPIELPGHSGGRSGIRTRKGRIDVETVNKEIKRLRSLWSGGISHDDGLDRLLPAQALAEIDPFDRAQLAFVISICRESRSLSEAGRKLFAASRERRASTNDADRLRKYLTRFELSWDELHRT